ncbi:MAG: HNH endonuclease [Desulfobacteraceae bacterium]|nr:HNH endonuclease [Desulfobacteraceae bacterium]
MTIKVCEYCGQEFRTQSKCRHFCSWECFLKGRRMMARSRRSNPIYKKYLPSELNRRNEEELLYWQHAFRYESRKERLRRSGGSFTREEFIAKCEECDWKCAYCGCELNETTVQRDHLTPLSRGGSNDISNIVPACRDCNNSKYAKSLWQWRRDLKRKQSTRQGKLE